MRVREDFVEIRGEGVEQVKQRFDAWRQNRKGGEHIPAALWTAAADLASVHGVERIARVLRVNGDGLAKRLVDLVKEEVTHGAQGKFIELLTPKVVGVGLGVSECVVELSNVRGAKMRVQFQGGDMVGLTGLIHTLWSAS